jgi:hypothetical protein
LKFVEQVVDVAGDAAGYVSVTYAVGQDYASDVIAAGENGGEVAAGFGAGRDGDDVGFEAGELEGTVGFFVASP